MVKKLILYSILYFSLILTLNLFYDDLGIYFFVLILVISFFFFLLILKEFYVKFIKNRNQKSEKIEFNQSANVLNSYKKISTKPFLFGLEDQLIVDYIYYFDEDNFYVFNRKSEKLTYLLSDIIELRKTSLQINNRFIWEVIIKQKDEEEISFKFAHNFTIWNKNFLEFYKIIKTKNPLVIRSKFSYWSL